MQSRICDCWLEAGSCFCELTTDKDERKRTDSDEESNQEHHGDAKCNPESNAKPKRPLDWDARDLEKNAWIPGSRRSTEGGYTGRFWEEEF